MSANQVVLDFDRQEDALLFTSAVIRLALEISAATLTAASLQ
jgi:hypothetical protein